MRLKVLIADDEEAARFGMARALSGRGYDIVEAADGEETLDRILTENPHLVLLDLNMPRLDGRGVLERLQGRGHGSEIVVVTATDSIDVAVECIRLGAADYVTKPFEVERLRAIARRAARRVELEEQVGELQGELDGRRAFGALVGASRPMARLFTLMERAAAAPVDVLIRGETGTGKELIAREIHRLGERAAGPFVAVNTAAVAETLAESELFGHVRGAFTGADRDRDGCFRQAHGGTLFLDEIGDMPLATQAKILRALEEREVTPVGTATPVAVDVRVISATHQDLERAAEEGHFRRDLYYRVRGIELEVPPLRHRREDILLLADYFLDRLAVRSRSPARRLSPAARDRLLAHAWPGNVRELEHVVTAAAALAEREEITAADLRLPERDRARGVAGGDDIDRLAGLGGADLDLDGLPLAESRALLVERFERRAIHRALEAADGNISAAARRLGIHRQSLQQKMDQLGIPRPERRGESEERRPRPG